MIERRLGPCASTVTLGDASDDGQPNAIPFELPITMPALEDPERLLTLGIVKAHPVVSDKVGAQLGVKTKRDVRIGLWAGELPGVLQQVLQQDAQQDFITLIVQVFRSLKLDPAVWGLSL